MADATADSDETRGLLQQVAAGDGQAFDQLLGRHRPMIRHFVELRLDTVLRARVDASDVVQETELEAFRKLPDYQARRPMPFRLWLRKTAFERLVVVRRQHRDAECRSVVRELPLPDRSSDLLARELVARDPTPSQALAHHELVRQIRSAIAQLPDLDREILLMRNFEELDYQEIGCILDIDPATARKRHGRALIRLHKLLLEGGLTEPPHE
jgi:RNA polymerase sigma-70 factor (ECF subfamily)